MKKRLISVFLLFALLLSAFSVISCDKDEVGGFNEPFNSGTSSTDTSTNTSTNQESNSSSSNTNTQGGGSTTDTDADVPAELQAAITNTLALNAYGASIDTGLDILAGYITLHNNIDVEIKVTDADSKKPKMYASYEIISIAKNASGELYTDGDWLYVSKETQYKQSLESDFEIDYIAVLRESVSKIPLDMFEGVGFEITENGKRAEITVSAEAFSGQFKEEIDKILSYSKDIPDIEITGASIAVTINNDYLKSYELSFDFNYMAVYEGTQTTGKASVTSVTTFAEPDAEITITPPSGYESFPELENE